LGNSQYQGKRAKPFYNPPSLVARQTLAALYFGFLIRWRKLPHWLVKGGKTLPTVAGAMGMGCIGFPIHPVWEVTAACNLRCRHCHANGGKRAEGELTTEEGKRLLEDLVSVDEFRMLVFTGGEPLVRPDIFELVEYASSLGLEVAIATNGTLITPEVAKRLKRIGVCDLAIGIDAADTQLHDFIRGVPGCFERTMRGIYATKEAGIALQLNITVMRYNYQQIPRLLDLADELDAEIVLLYQVIPMGRAKDDLELSVEEYAALTKLVSQRQKNSRPIIEPICSPQYWAYLVRRNGRGALGMKLAQIAFKGCVAGSGLCYIKPDGEVWPCPFIPVSAGNVRLTPLSEIWDKSELFHTLRDRRNLKGKCGECSYNNICGGCRGRAYAHSGDFLAEDPHCFLSHSERKKGR
jgi:radical SAM protein with 4Fe4S-binding SPASM domain